MCNYNNNPNLRFTAAPIGGQLQLQRDPPKAYKVQRLLVANRVNYSPHTEHSAPLWLLSAITTPKV